MTRLLPCGGPSAFLVPLGLAFAAAGFGGTLYVNNGLPSGGNAANWNSSTASRSDVDWFNTGGGVGGGGFLNGDSFTLPGSSMYMVDSISVFVVLNKAGDAPANEFNLATVALYGGTSGDANTPACGANNCPFSLQSTSAVFTSVSVPGASNGCTGYLATDGVTCLPIYEVTFATNILVQGGVTYSFAADGSVLGTLSGCAGTCGWYNLAANGTLAGWSSFTNEYLNWDATALNAGFFTINSSPGCAAGPAADVCGGWDKSSNMAELVTANIVPEPATLSLFGLGIGVMSLVAIRRRASSRKTAG